MTLSKTCTRNEGHGLGLLKKANRHIGSNFWTKPGKGNLWKAATYLEPHEGWECTPALRIGTDKLRENKEKAQDSLDGFFPEMDERHEGHLPQVPLELPWHTITELEIQRSLEDAKGSTAPG